MCPGVFSYIILAEGAGFEPANLRSTVFKTRAIDHSAIPRIFNLLTFRFMPREFLHSFSCRGAVHQE